MIPCPDREVWRRFLGDEPFNESTSEVSRHLNECATCQTICDELLSTPSSTIEVGAVAPRGDTLDRLVQRLVAAPRSPVIAASSAIQLPGAGNADAPLGWIGPYAAIERIAEGSQGVLFRARDPSLNRVVAIKVLHPHRVATDESRDRFLREARLGAALQSPHVVRVLQIGNEPGLPPFLVLEYVEGESLRAHLDLNGPADAAECVRFVKQIALGLEAAHAAGMIHRDVKPSNVLLDRRGTVKLADFGLAMEGAPGPRLTHDGTIVGTPSYMSPEQIVSPRSVDPRTDLYSLGVIFYELLTGEVPFRGSLRMTLLQIAHDEPLPPTRLNDQIPKDLETICLRLLAKNPNSRFQSARDLIEELERWSSGRPILSRPISAVERLWRWRRRNPVVSMLTLAVAGLVIAIGGILSWSTWTLSEARHRAEQHATAAIEQRDAALDTLTKLVFQLQRRFDRDEIDLAELQRQSLQIALDGLRKVRLRESESAQPDLPTAEALRRMGEVMLELDDPREAIICLEQAEEILHRNLTRFPNDAGILKSLVETLWIRADVDEDDESLDETKPDSGVTHLARLHEATILAKKHQAVESSDVSQWMVASALFRESREQLDLGDPQQAARIAGECHEACRNLLRPDPPEETDVRAVWLAAAEIRYLALMESDSADAAFAFLSDCMRELQTPAFSTERGVLLLVAQCSLHEWFVSECERRKLPSLTEETAKFAERSARIASRCKADSVDLAIAIEELDGAVDQRLDQEAYAGAIRLFHVGISAIEQRLSVDPYDQVAIEELPHYWFEVAETQLDDDQPPVIVWPALERSVRFYRELPAKLAMKPVNQRLMIDALTAAAEVAMERNDPQWRNFAQESQKLLNSNSKSIEVKYGKGWLQEIRARLADLNQR